MGVEKRTEKKEERLEQSCSNFLREMMKLDILVSQKERFSFLKLNG